MHRIALKGNDSYKWFDRDAAQSWGEDYVHDGHNNRLSLATGSQYEHEHLYRTRKGVWILNRWSNGRSSQETYRIINSDAAAAWLIRNNEEPPDDLAETVASLEI